MDTIVSKLLQRAQENGVISHVDFRRLPQVIQDGIKSGDIKGIRPSWEGEKVAPLFKHDESIYDRIKLQGKISVGDYAMLSVEERRQSQIQGIEIDRNIDTVMVQAPKQIAQYDYSLLTANERANPLVEWVVIPDGSQA